MKAGDTEKFWWCTSGQNPLNLAQASDVIRYQTVDPTTHEASDSQIVLSESPDGWDSSYTCNPHVIQGVFTNPLGNGVNYTYEMFYVGTASGQGINNSIGAAFSTDGVTWAKYPQPVIPSTTPSAYGVGQPVPYNTDGKSAITLLYEDNRGTVTHHLEASSADGIHFTTQGTLTMAGLDPANPQPSWGDAAYDPSANVWYAAFNEGVRPPSTTGNFAERGQYGLQIYRIPATSLLNGTTPWQLLKTVDTNATGNESNFLAAFLKDMFGNIVFGASSSLQLFPSISNPPPAWNATPLQEGDSGGIGQWDIGTFTWAPGKPVALNRYHNLVTYEVTTGWIDPGAGYKLDVTLGHLYEGPQNGSDLALYGCKSGATNYFVSTDKDCGGQHIQGLQGYGYSSLTKGLTLVPLYSCVASSTASFVSKYANCESRGTGSFLGYALP